MHVVLTDDATPAPGAWCTQLEADGRTIVSKTGPDRPVRRERHTPSPVPELTQLHFNIMTIIRIFILNHCEIMILY